MPMRNFPFRNHDDFRPFDEQLESEQHGAPYRLPMPWFEAGSLSENLKKTAPGFHGP